MEITLSEFIQMLLNAVSSNCTTKYVIHEYGKKQFSLYSDLTFQNEMYLKINEKNRYIVLFTKIQEAFPNQCEVSYSNYKYFPGQLVMFIKIQKVRIVLEYRLTAGQNWIHSMANWG